MECAWAPSVALNCHRLAVAPWNGSCMGHIIFQYSNKYSPHPLTQSRFSVPLRHTYNLHLIYRSAEHPFFIPFIYKKPPQSSISGIHSHGSSKVLGYACLYGLQRSTNLQPKCLSESRHL